MVKKNFRYFRPACAAILLFSVLSIGPYATGQAVLDHFNKAQEYQSAGQPDLAIAELKLAVQQEPDNAFYLTKLGMAYLDSGYIESAMENLERAVSLNDGIPDAYTGLGVCYNTIGQYQKSIDNFNKALALTPETSPDMAVLHNNLGQNYYLMKQYDKAEEELNKAVELDDRLLTAYINLGNVYTERGDYERSIEYHKKAVEIAPQYSLPRNNLAFAYYMMNDYEKALAEMEKVLQTDPDNKQFKENYDFLSAKYAEHREKTYQEGPLAGLPKEISLEDKPRQEFQPKPAETPVETPAEPAAVAQAPAAEQPADVVAAASVEDKTYEPRERVSTDRDHAAPAEQPAPAQETPAVQEAPAEPPAPAQQPVVVETPAEKAPAAAEAPVEVKEPAEIARKQPAAEKKPVAEKPAAKISEKPGAEVAEAPTPEERTHAGEYQQRDRKRASLYKDQRDSAAKSEEEAKATDRAEEHYRAAKYNLKNNDAAGAAEEISKALAISPDNLDYRTVEAMVKEKEGSLHEAATMYRRILDKEPDHSAARNSLGHTQELLGRVDIAEDEYAQAFESDPVNGCAAGNLGSRMAFNGNCAEAADLLTTAVERQCLTASVLNNLSYCYFENGDMENAMQISLRAIEKDPSDRTILSNFSFLAHKSDFDFQPIKVSADTEIDPFQRAMQSEKMVALNSLTPVETLDFYDAIQNNYKVKTVLLVPYQHPRGTERWSPTPAEAKTERMANMLRESGRFNVVIADKSNYEEPYGEKVQDASLEKMLEKQPADIVYVGQINKGTLRDEEKSLYLGLKKKSYVKSTLPIRTTVIDTDSDETLVDGEVTGEAQVSNRISSTMMYREITDLNDSAFDNYVANMNEMLLDHYNLVRLPVKKDIVKYVKKKPWRKAGLTR